MNTSPVLHFRISKLEQAGGIVVHTMRQGKSDEPIFLSTTEALRLAELLILQIKLIRGEDMEAPL